MTVLGVELTSPVVLVYLVLAAGWIGLKVLVVLWIKQDAAARRVDGRPWWMAAILFDLVVLLIWLVARPRTGRKPRPVDVARGGAARVAPLSSGPTPTAGGPVEAPPASSERVLRSVKCPACGNVFPFAPSRGGPTRVRCPECGSAGSV